MKKLLKKCQQGDIIDKKLSKLPWYGLLLANFGIDSIPLVSEARDINSLYQGLKTKDYVTSGIALAGLALPIVSGSELKSLRRLGYKYFGNKVLKNADKAKRVYLTTEELAKDITKNGTTKLVLKDLVEDYPLLKTYSKDLRKLFEDAIDYINNGKSLSVRSLNGKAVDELAYINANSAINRAAAKRFADRHGVSLDDIEVVIADRGTPFNYKLNPEINYRELGEFSKNQHGQAFDMRDLHAMKAPKNYNFGDIEKANDALWAGDNAVSYAAFGDGKATLKNYPHLTEDELKRLNDIDKKAKELVGTRPRGMNSGKQKVKIEEALQQEGVNEQLTFLAHERARILGDVNAGGLHKVAYFRVKDGSHSMTVDVNKAVDKDFQRFGNDGKYVTVPTTITGIPTTLKGDDWWSTDDMANLIMDKNQTSTLLLQGRAAKPKNRILDILVNGVEDPLPTNNVVISELAFPYFTNPYGLLNKKLI